MPTPADSGPIAPVVEWQLKSKGAEGETRTYEQSELSIEGEARLLGMARKIGAVLKDADFDLGKVSNMIDSTDPVDWDIILDGVALVVENAPDLVGESTLILLGIFPTDEDGSPNPAYAEHLIFIKRTVNTAKFSDMLRVFIAQNDYERIARPLWNRFAQAATPTPTPTPDSPPPTGTEVSTA